MKGFRTAGFVGLDVVLDALDTVGLRLMRVVDADPAFQVFRLLEDLTVAVSGSLLDLRRNGLLEKKPDRFFWIDLSGDAIPGSSTPPAGVILVGDEVPDIGSALVYELGTEYWLSLSRLPGRVLLDIAEPVAEGGATSDLQNMVIPSVGY